MNLLKISTKKLLLISFYLILLFLGFILTYNLLDPDFGWHIKTGQLILERGIPDKDWYSYTMPDFPWVNHEWLIDVLMYKIYSLFGFYILLTVFVWKTHFPSPLTAQILADFYADFR